MRLFAVGAHLAGEPDAPMLWTRPCVMRGPHERALSAYADAGGDRYTMRLAEFVEVAHAPTDRPPAPEAG